MARSKKEAALTPEERLQAALVPDWEWPYKLPKNWCWTRMQEIAQWGSGGTPSRKVSEYYNGDISWVKTGELNDDYIFATEEHITQEAISHSSAKIYPTDTVVIAMYGATIGKVGILGIPAATNQACACAIVKPSTDYKYLFYYAQSQKDDFIKKGKGGAQPNISQEIIKFHQFPLPPLAEQQRIVDRIESLFVKLDAAKEKAQAVVDSFENRKAAILHKAFTGELTAKWREEHGVSIDNWKTTRFDSVAAIRSNLADPAEYQSFPHIAPDNIEKKTGVLLEYHTIAEDGVTSGKHRFYSGQILYSKIRPYLSKAVVVDFDGLCSADMYPIEAYQNARCLWYYMLSDEFLLQASTAGSRSVLPKINQKELSALTVHLPTNDREQEEIARILDELFDKEQQTKETTEIVLDQIELMKKSILARAFRGELGTNDPSEESAVELLKKVLHTSAEPKSKTKRKFIPKKIEAQIKTDLERKIIMAFIQNDTTIMPIQQLMSVSSRKFDVIETLRNLQERGILLKENDTYRLMG